MKKNSPLQNVFYLQTDENEKPNKRFTEHEPWGLYSSAPDSLSMHIRLSSHRACTALQIVYKDTHREEKNINSLTLFARASPCARSRKTFFFFFVYTAPRKIKTVSLKLTFTSVPQLYRTYSRGAIWISVRRCVSFSFAESGVKIYLISLSTGGMGVMGKFRHEGFLGKFDETS